MQISRCLLPDEDHTYLMTYSRGITWELWGGGGYSCTSICVLPDEFLLKSI